MEHKFTPTIYEKLKTAFGGDTKAIYQASPLLQYINIKTKSAEKGSKARGSFANLYAIYVLVEDYIKGKFSDKRPYKAYEGAQFSNLFKRQRELPFGQKLQNHALNARLNDEFHKYFPQVESRPIIRNVDTNKYWFNENLLAVMANKRKFNIAEAVIAIIDSYVAAKQDAFDKFIDTFEKLRDLEAGTTNRDKAIAEITGMLAPNVDARIFEIVSYSILKYYYHHQVVFFGFDLKKLQRENLTLHKTGRTNANDGGIDFVMRPLGRFFQVTETTDVRKYFLDIDKIQRFPITFVVKSEDSVDALKANIKEKASEQYPVTVVVDRYMGCIEELINVPILIERFKEAIGKDYLNAIIDEIIRQSKVEFNYEEIEEEAAASAVDAAPPDAAVRKKS
jgi:hypothetical protein